MLNHHESSPTITPPRTVMADTDSETKKKDESSGDDDAQQQQQYCRPTSSSLEDNTSSHPTTPPTTSKIGRSRSMSISKSSSHDNIPLSMKIIRPFFALCCQACGARSSQNNNTQYQPFNFQDSLTTTLNTQIARGTSEGSITPTPNNNPTNTNTPSSSSSPSYPPPSTHVKPTPDTIHAILQQYIAATAFYGCHTTNAGILTTIRFSLPTLRVTSSFHDCDMLALAEILFQHANTSLRHIRRLDFSVGAVRGKLHGNRGFRSHGALTLSKVLEVSDYIEEVGVQRNTIGPYGASALFNACCRKGGSVKVLRMRRCRVGERGALAFVEEVRGCDGGSRLMYVDLSMNRIGFRGTMAIEEMLSNMEEKMLIEGGGGEEEKKMMEIDMEGNLVFQEVMNGVTHGFGIILCFVGAFTLLNRVKHAPLNNYISCGVYSFSLLVLYTSSTLYHSFFALTLTRYVFEVLDHCAIYILIAGSYTPFLRIAMIDKPIGSFYLLGFIWTCCILGLTVEAFYPDWIYKPKFTLAMYLGMGWSCLACMPDLLEALPIEAVHLIILGGVAYTSGVPFFVRNNNLDHTIWHLFVMAGSICHWVSIFWYVAPMNQGGVEGGVGEG